MTDAILDRVPPPPRRLFESAATALTAVGTFQDLLERVRLRVPFQHYTVSGLPVPGRGVGTGTLLADNWPEEFRRHYLGRQWFKDCAVVTTLRQVRAPASTTTVRAVAVGSPVRRHRFELSLDAMGREIVTMPVRALGRLIGSATFRRDEPFGPEELDLLGLLAPALHGAATGLPSATPPAILTARERECLCWVAQGKTGNEIGDLLGISANTVITHLNTAMRKLGAASRPHAVALALRNGLID